MDNSLNTEMVVLYDAVVSKTPTVEQFSTIADALRDAPDDDSIYRVCIHSGTYHERLVINRKNVHLIGSGRDQTIITQTLVAAEKGDRGEIIGTFQTQTIEVNASGFMAQFLTIRNDFDLLENALKSDSDRTKLHQHTQAVALLLGEMSDKAAFLDVSLEGYQDTFCSLGGRAYFTQSRISGTVDFIFGSGVVVFNYCDIVSRYCPSQNGPMGYLTAPSTSHKQEYGLSFFQCRLLKEDARVSAKSYALGRPWHPTTTFLDGRYADPNAIGKSTFLNTAMDDHIFGWDKMHGTSIEGERIWFTPEEHARFAEYSSTGAGAASATALEPNYRPQLTWEEAKEYSLANILAGWQPTF
ncbi:pectinesterase family protein [Marinomonas transparens]|uniref:Pectinesterase n=1 Tax=Marinomonas transparens TaxID=2795388 RepID=A0A934MZC1_9GAMM|nr:pectinesterase family protein [Marinomonas transparens]MBJ7537385.1 pectinesterase A [Marinomonas transparens]